MAVAVSVRCEARVGPDQCRQRAKVYRRVIGRPYGLCGAHLRLPTSQLHLLQDDPERVAALYRQAHPRAKGDGRGT